MGNVESIAQMNHWGATIIYFMKNNDDYQRWSHMFHSNKAQNQA